MQRDHDLSACGESFPSHDGWSFSESFHCLFLNRAMRSGYHVEGGTKKATNPEVSSTCCHGLASVDALVGDIFRLYGKGQFARAAAMDLRAQRTIITINNNKQNLTLIAFYF